MKETEREREKCLLLQHAHAGLFGTHVYFFFFFSFFSLPPHNATFIPSVNRICVHVHL